MLISTARTWVKDIAREADDDTVYPASRVDRAIASVLARFLRATRILTSLSNLDLSDADPDLPDLPGGFKPECFVKGWLDDDHESDVVLRADEYLRWQRSENDSHATPQILAFTSSSAGQVWPTPNDDYTLTMRWWRNLPVIWTPGGSMQATATATVAAGAVTAISVTSSGFGYLTAPAVTFSGGAGSSAAATAVLDEFGCVARVTVTNAGTGYTSAPTVTIASLDDFSLMCPDDWMPGILKGCAAELQRNNPQFAATANLHWNEYVAWEAGMKGTSRLGVHRLVRERGQ